VFFVFLLVVDFCCIKVYITMQSLMLLFKKKTPQTKGKCCTCVLYDDLGCCSRNLFDEEFPSSSSLQASVGHSIRGVRLGVDSSIECKPDGTVFASATPEIESRFYRIGGTVECGADKTRGKLCASVCDIPKLPGFAGEVTVSNKDEYCRLKTQYRHKNFSVLSNNAFKENRDFVLGLSTVACSTCASIAAGLTGEAALRKSEGKKLCDVSLSALDGRVCFVRGPWNLLLESANFGRDYKLSVMRKMLMPHFTNEMIIAARLSAHAAIPNMAEAKTWKDKALAVNAALTPMATVAVRTKLTDSSSAKIKVDTKGMVGFSFSEQLSQWAHAVFAVNVDATQLSNANNHKFAFTLTLTH